MQKAAIAIDDWKLPIFKKHLAAAGYEFEEHAGVTGDTLTLTVSTTSLRELGKVVQAANTEAKSRKLQ